MSKLPRKRTVEGPERLKKVLSEARDEFLISELISRGYEVYTQDPEAVNQAMRSLTRDIQKLNHDIEALPREKDVILERGPVGKPEFITRYDDECGALSAGFVCRRVKDHPGPHRASNYEDLVE